MEIEARGSKMLIRMHVTAGRDEAIGNPDEHTIMDFATIIRDMIDPTLPIVNLGSVTDDPQRRQPDITRAKTWLNWEPKFSLSEGLIETVHYFKSRLDHYGEGPAGLLAGHVSQQAER